MKKFLHCFINFMMIWMGSGLVVESCNNHNSIEYIVGMIIGAIGSIFMFYIADNKYE